jgi:hypothetical protein
MNYCYKPSHASTRPRSLLTRSLFLLLLCCSLPLCRSCPTRAEIALANRMKSTAARRRRHRRRRSSSSSSSRRRMLAGPSEADGRLVRKAVEPVAPSATRHLMTRRNWRGAQDNHATTPAAAAMQQQQQHTQLQRQPPPHQQISEDDGGCRNSGGGGGRGTNVQQFVLTLRVPTHHRRQQRDYIDKLRTHGSESTKEWLNDRPLASMSRNAWCGVGGRAGVGGGVGGSGGVVLGAGGGAESCHEEHKDRPNPRGLQENVFLSATTEKPRVETRAEARRPSTLARARTLARTHAGRQSGALTERLKNEDRVPTGTGGAEEGWNRTTEQRRNPTNQSSIVVGASVMFPSSPPHARTHTCTHSHTHSLSHWLTGSLVHSSHTHTHAPTHPQTSCPARAARGP